MPYKGVIITVKHYDLVTFHYSFKAVWCVCVPEVY